MTASRDDLVVGGQRVPPGERRDFDLPAALLPTHTQLHLPLAVLNGLEPGPRVWVSAAVHGDELNGVEIIQRLLAGIDGPLEKGALIAVPIVNVFGFIGQSRYLPDRRDLNRSFPGSARGSLAARIANLFLNEVVRGCTHGIDLHTAARDRTNLAQVRANLEDPPTLAIAEHFGAPVMVHAPVRQGSLRGAAGKLGIPVLVFEGGEALRFDEQVIQMGVQGVRRVLGALGLTPAHPAAEPPSRRVLGSSWVRARRGGVLRLSVSSGQALRKNEKIGTIADPLGENALELRAPFAGMVIGHTQTPIVHGGDAVVHLGKIEDG